MKLEKINDNQIRCTLNKSDLTSRHIKLSELAYGSEKAKELFREMMQQASYEFGFEAEDVPLMIEAIPISAECIVLIVTKVEDPEELDTRFSKFTSEDNDDDDDYPYEEPLEGMSAIEEIDSTPDVTLTAEDELPDSIANDVFTPTGDVADDVINLFSKVKDYLTRSANAAREAEAAKNADSTKKNASSNNADAPTNETIAKNNLKKAMEQSQNKGSDNFVSLKDTLQNRAGKGTEKPSAPVTRIFSFEDFDAACEACAVISVLFQDKSALYKDAATGRHYLILEKRKCSDVDFNKTCNMLSEYGSKENLTQSSTYYFMEHYQCIIPKNAVTIAASLA